MVAIAQCDAQHIRYAAIIAGSSTHPQDVMVAPLDVKIVESAQDVHNLVRTGTTVIDISQKVKHVNGQLLNEVAHGNDEVIDTVRRNDGLDDHIHIGLLVGIAAVLVHELLNNVGKVLR